MYSVSDVAIFRTLSRVNEKPGLLVKELICEVCKTSMMTTKDSENNLLKKTLTLSPNKTKSYLKYI